MNVISAVFPNVAATTPEASSGAAPGAAGATESSSGQGLGINPFALLLSGQIRGAADLAAAPALEARTASGNVAAAVAQLLPAGGKALPEGEASPDASGSEDQVGPLASLPLQLAAVLPIASGEAVAASVASANPQHGDWSLEALKLALANGQSADARLPTVKEVSGDEQSSLRTLHAGVIRAEVDPAGSLMQPHGNNHQVPASAGHGDAPVNAAVAVAGDQGLRMAADPQPRSVIAAAQTTLQQPIGGNGWDQELAGRLVWMNKQDLQSAQLRINPAHLGPLEVRLSLQSDHTASVAFVSNHAPVRDAVEAAIPRLREMLADNGVNLADVNVSSHSQGQAQQHGAASGGWFAQADVEPDAMGLGEMVRGMKLGLVDYFA